MFLFIWFISGGGGGGLMTTSSVFWSKRKQNQNQKLCQVDEKWSETGRDVMLTSK